MCGPNTSCGPAHHSIFYLKGAYAVKDSKSKYRVARVVLQVASAKFFRLGRPNFLRSSAELQTVLSPATASPNSKLLRSLRQADRTPKRLSTPGVGSQQQTGRIRNRDRRRSGKLA